MKDNLLPIGSVVVVENTENQPCEYLVIGHRIINPFSMKSWDYISVEYPQGLRRIFNEKKEHDHDNFFYFNHFNIDKIIHRHKTKESKVLSVDV